MRGRLCRGTAPENNYIWRPKLHAIRAVCSIRILCSIRNFQTLTVLNIALRSEVLTAVKVEIMMFGVGTPCTSFVGDFTRFERGYCLYNREKVSQVGMKADYIRKAVSGSGERWSEGRTFQ
jgi:hypothetical protein